jgi:hypothetical protein
MSLLVMTSSTPELTKNTVDTSLIQELKSFKAYSSLRAARADSRLVGIRAKKQKEGKEDAPAAAAAQE